MTESIGLPNYGRWQDLWGHYGPQLLSGSIAGAILLGITPRAATLASLLLSLGLIAFVPATWLVMRRHDRRLCEACVAAMPLNPTEQASRFGRRFFLAHLASNPLYLVPYLIVLIGSNFLTSQSGRYVWAVVQASMIYLILANSTHRKLQPWCPRCSDGGGGSLREDVPEPDGPRGSRLQFS